MVDTKEPQHENIKTTKEEELFQTNQLSLLDSFYGPYDSIDVPIAEHIRRFTAS